MRCPRCQHHNPDHASRCERCQSPLPTPDPWVGALIAGRFRVLRRLGDGGMGRVYLAEQPMGKSSRKVAVKTLLAEHSGDDELLDRFQRECELIAQLEHPNIVHVYDFGRADDGSLYIAMEYVEGETLAARIARAPLAPRVTMRILGQICGALDEAHRHGILHRDLKPDNVMLTSRAGQEDFVKLLDFGIAKRNDPSGDATQLTRAGAAVGTPAYMSPEQFRGQPLDPRSDIYALGVVAYQMLTGAMPFDATTPWEWATHHMLTPPRSFDTSPLGAHVPLPVRRAIDRALSKEPATRQPTAGAFLAELNAAAPGASGMAPALSPSPGLSPSMASSAPTMAAPQVTPPYPGSPIGPTAPMVTPSYPVAAGAPPRPLPLAGPYAPPQAPQQRPNDLSPLVVVGIVFATIFMLLLGTCTIAVLSDTSGGEAPALGE